jgi:hypothetical protein
LVHSFGRLSPQLGGPPLLGCDSSFGKAVHLMARMRKKEEEEGARISIPPSRVHTSDRKTSHWAPPIMFPPPPDSAKLGTKPVTHGPLGLMKTQTIV